MQNDTDEEMQLLDICEAMEDMSFTEEQTLNNDTLQKIEEVDLTIFNAASLRSAIEDMASWKAISDARNPIEMFRCCRFKDKEAQNAE